MASLRLRTFATLTSNFAAGVQGRARDLIDFSEGAVLRAVGEAMASLALWLQGEIAYVLTLTRGKTSKGADLDTWVADYGLTRLGVVAASGLVTFSRFTADAAAFVPVGTAVQTTDGRCKFTVVADATNPSYVTADDGYVIPAGVPSLSVPVRAVTPGATSNVVRGAITVITSSLFYVDTVINVAAFTNGAEAESDEALQVRKVQFFGSLAKATNPALALAVSSLQLGVQYTITENQDRDGRSQPGFVFVVIDDGTGYPPASLLDAVRTAIERVRASGVSVAVFPPTVVPTETSFTIEVARGYDKVAVEAAAAIAAGSYINGLGLGATLRWSHLWKTIYDASPGITNVTGLLVNGRTTDVVAGAQVTIKSVNVIPNVLAG